MFNELRRELREETGDGLAFVSCGKEIRLSIILFSKDSNLSYEFIKTCVSGASISRLVAIKTTPQM